MNRDTSTAAAPESSAAPRCVRCFRPADLCLCASIPRIDNRTQLFIVQHRRERSHAFNTARIVRQAFARCQVFCDHTPRLADQFASAPLSQRAGLLYPGRDARRLDDLAPRERPDQLVVVDGTWNHAGLLIRDLPRLGTLPKYSLAPSAPSRYRIRRQPDADGLSTLEAIVAALRVLEPGTGGLDRLLSVFDQMIDQHLGRGRDNWRRNRRRRRGAINIPRALSGCLADVVVAYGEGRRGGPQTDGLPRLPVYWVAQRLESGERFRCAIQSDCLSDPEFVGRLRLTPDVIESAVSIDVFRHRWSQFLRDDDRVVVYHPGTARLLRNAGAEFSRCVILKSVRFERPSARGTLDEVVRALGIEPPQRGSRAAHRLASAMALVHYVNGTPRLPC